MLITPLHRAIGESRRNSLKTGLAVILKKGENGFMATTAYVVFAEFSVGAEQKAEFLELCKFDSVRSTTDEAGCSQFDVSASEELPELVVLYEVYADKAAFDLHMKTPHYEVFRAGVERLGVTVTQVRFFTRQYA